MPSHPGRVGQTLPDRYEDTPQYWPGADSRLVGMAAMVTRRSSSDISAPNFHEKPITDNELIRGFILALRPVGAGNVA